MGLGACLRAKTTLSRPIAGSGARGRKPPWGGRLRIERLRLRQDADTFAAHKLRGKAHHGEA